MGGSTSGLGRNRFLLTGFLANLALGTIYSWSIFREPLEKTFHASSTESGLPYMFFLLFFALCMPLGGVLIRRIGPRQTAFLGSALVGTGWILAGYSGSVGFLSLAYGVLGGMGVGIAYGVPLAVAARWFPDRRGVALGLVLMGFGLSPLITAPIAAATISAYSLLPAFRIIGIGLFLLLLFLSITYRYPDEQEERELPPPPAKRSTGRKELADLTTKQMVHTREFYGLWSSYVIGTLVGLTAIGITGPFAQHTVGLTAGQAAASVSIFALCNGLGRPLFGYVTDRLGVLTAILIAFGAIVLAASLLLLGGGGSFFLFAVSFALLWLLLGGWLAIAPAATTTLFGAAHYPANYGVMYTAYGVGAVLGTLLSGEINDIFGSYLYTFIPVILLALLGSGVAVATLRRGREAR